MANTCNDEKKAVKTNVEEEKTVEAEESASNGFKAKMLGYVNPILGWCLFGGSLAIAVIIALIVLL